MKNSSFTVYQTDLTNKIVETTYKPSTTVLSYTYTVYKDDEVFEKNNVKGNKSTNFIFEESGTYKIKIEKIEKGNVKKTEESGLYKLDTTSPKIIIQKPYIEIHKLKENKDFNIKEFEDNIIVYDPEQGKLFDKLTCDTSNNDFTKLGTQKITCSVSDSAGNTETKEIIFKVTKDHSKELNTLLGIVILLSILLVYSLIRYIRSINLEKKIIKYSTESLHDRRKGTIDKVINEFYKWIKKLNSILLKSEVIKKYSKKYDKYIPLYSSHYKEGIDFVSTKVFSGILFIIISILSSIIRYKLIIIYELILPFIFGFFLPDIIYIVNYKLYKQKLENDLLQAIIIMNNAFKSGRSIQQAIELVTKELSGPIGLEFKKMHMEISFGLSIEEVFKRLADRIQIEEVTYLTASLTILNKTGGNIIKVFSSIERTLFSKKRLRLELASLTGSSKMIVYILFLVPFFFILFISLIEPTYFVPLYTTPLGLIITSIMLVIYLLYVWTVRKIMKVRM